MMNPVLDQFGKVAQRLSRNPLGIIALFIVLVYGIAALLLGFSSRNLEPSERSPLIWFLVLFPVLVLVAFYLLVAYHHVKLYAPHDFPDKEGFFRALTPTEQKQRLEEETKEITDDMQQAEGSRARSLELQKDGILDVVSNRHTYVLAEELAFREIENEFGVSVRRQVAIGQDWGIDGVFTRGGKPVIVEIKYIRRPSPPRIPSIQIERFRTLMESTRLDPFFLLAIVADGLDKNESDLERKRIEEAAKKTALRIDVRVYDFNILKRKYGISTSDPQPSA